MNDNIFSDSWYWVFQSRLRHLQSLALSSVDHRTLNDLSTHCVNTLTSLNLIEQSTTICNAEHMEAVLNCQQLIELNICVEATETKESVNGHDKWIWKVPSDNGWKALPNLKRLTLFIQVQHTESKPTPLASLVIDDSWNQLESITLGGNWYITEAFIDSKALQSCQQLHFVGNGDDEQKRPRMKQLSSISYLLQCHLPLLTQLSVSHVNDKIIDVVNNITTLTSLNISSVWKKTDGRPIQVPDKKRLHLLQSLFKHLPSLQHFTFTQQNHFESILDKLIPLMKRLTSVNISMVRPLPSPTKLLRLLESLPLLKLVQFGDYDPVEWTNMISLRAMVSVASTTSDNDWKVDIARMIAAIRSTGNIYIEWDPMRDMKVCEWIDFDESFIPSQPSSLALELPRARTRWSELNRQLLGGIVEMIDNWKEWLNITQVCASWRDSLSIPLKNDISHLGSSKGFACMSDSKQMKRHETTNHVGYWKKANNHFFASYPRHRSWLPLLGTTRLQYVRSITFTDSSFVCNESPDSYCRHLPCLRELCFKWDSVLSFLEWCHNLQWLTNITTLDIHITDHINAEQCLVLPLASSVTTLKLSMDCPGQQSLLLHPSWGSQLLSLTLKGAWEPVWSIPRNLFNDDIYGIDTNKDVRLDEDGKAKPFVFQHLIHFTVMLDQLQYSILDLFDVEINYFPSLTYICCTESVPDEYLEFLKLFSTTLREIDLV
jgi:hypothetical protein